MIAPLYRTFFIGDAAAVFPLNHDDLTVVLLMIFFGVAIGVGLACLFLMLRTLRRRTQPSLIPGRIPALVNRPTPNLPHPMPPLPGRWLAISGSNLGAVQRALGIDHATPCSWADGLAVAGQQRLFLTPPLQGWILVFGAALPDPAKDVDRCFVRLTALSQELGQVQFFSSHLAPQQHAWAMLDRGQVVRAYAWAGRTLWNQGSMTRAERECGLTCLDYGADDDNNIGLNMARMIHNTEHVAELAGRWGIDPAAIAARLWRDGQGIAGEISRTKAH